MAGPHVGPPELLWRVLGNSECVVFVVFKVVPGLRPGD